MRKIYSSMLSAVCALSLSPTLASAAPTASIGGGTTTVRLNDAFRSALSTANIRLSKVEESRLATNILSFPVIEGVLDLADARGEIEHSGGFRLSTASTNMRFTNLIIDTQNFSKVITAEVIVNNSVVGRIPIFDVTLPAITLPIRNASSISITGVVLRLRSEAADALNITLGKTSFQGGQRVGRGVVTLTTGRSQ